MVVFNLSILVLILVPFAAPLHSALAQTPTLASDPEPPHLSIATTHEVNDPNLVDGDIISLHAESNTFTRSRTPGDMHLYGVYEATPSVVFRTYVDAPPIMSAGEVYTNMTTINGVIKPGDYVTSSEIPGKGQKATDFSGYMLGMAMEGFDGKNPDTTVRYKDKDYPVKQIKVSILIGPSTPSLFRSGSGVFGILNQLGTFSGGGEGSIRLMRYLIAALVAAISIGAAFMVFSRNVTKGIESIGRNPLAKANIQAMIVLNSVFVGLLALGGVLLSLAIIRF